MRGPCSKRCSQPRSSYSFSHRRRRCLAIPSALRLKRTIPFVPPMRTANRNCWWSACWRGSIRSPACAIPACGIPRPPPPPGGTCIRDYIPVSDLARAPLLALHALEDARANSRPLIYNLGNGQGFSVRQVVEVAREVTGHPIPVIESPRRAGDPAVLIASSEKIRRALGWQPNFPDLKTIVESAWQWHRTRPEGYGSH